MEGCVVGMGFWWVEYGTGPLERSCRGGNVVDAKPNGWSAQKVLDSASTSPNPILGRWPWRAW